MALGCLGGQADGRKMGSMGCPWTSLVVARSRAGDSARYSIQVPTVGNALEFVVASVFEHHARADDEVPHSTRDEDLPGRSQRSDTRSDDDP